MNSKWIPVTAGVIDIALGLWGMIVSSGMYLISAFIDDPNNVFTDGWALVVLLLSLCAIAGGIFAMTRRRWMIALIGSAASIAPSLPFAILFFANLNLHREFRPDTLLAFAWVLAIIPFVLVYRSKPQFQQKTD
ncbi:MAG: hypothetical protein JW712_03150 [Dehalococcoidales bacterium]|nr:hypothetical protein [Dehalococcoidales bacterium]